MKKVFVSFILQLCFICFAGEYKKVPVDLPYGPTTLKVLFYCFNDLETGQEIADFLYKKMDLKAELKKGGFKKLMVVPPGSEITAWNYSIMSYEREFWFFENRDDGWLWGTGRW